MSTLANDIEAQGIVVKPPVELEVALLTGCQDKPYALGLSMALVSKGVCLDIIGNDAVDSPELHASPKINFLDLYGKQEGGLARKAWRWLILYARLIRYASISRPKIFHILWNNKFQFFDRTLLMLYYKLQRKKIVFTAHNVNAGKRDSQDSLLNRMTLRVQYRLANHIFVHTEKMKQELLEDFSVREQAITVIPFGINNAVPQTDLTPAEAKQRLGIRQEERAILAYGRIRPYKGLEYLISAFQSITRRHANYRLIIAGERKKGYERYFEEIQRAIRHDLNRDQVIQKIEFIPDEDTELYFKAADVLALPYTRVFQSGVLFLAYSFGLPVIAADVGSFKEDIIDGRTGFLCKPCDSGDLAKTIEIYFDSPLFKCLGSRRQEIRNYANARHSWDLVGDMTRNVYAQMLGHNPL